MLDSRIWIGLFLLTAVLYMIKWWQGTHKVTVYRISPQSLTRSKEVMLKVLPLVEDDRDVPLDLSRLPYSKESIKSAAKILAYYYWKKNRPDELTRVKNCFVAIARFQNRDEDDETRTRHMERDKKRLQHELDHYLTHYPFKARTRTTPAKK